MANRKSILMILAMVLILPFAFMLSGCFGNNNNDNNNNEPLPEGYYRITVQQTTGGSVNASKNSAQEGEEITLSYRANSGYLFVKLTVKDGNNQDVELNDNKFTMPASDVTVSATFERISNQKYLLDLQHGDNYVIELISPDERQFAEDRGMIQAGTRVVLGCDIWYEGYELKSWNVVDANGNRVIVTNNSFIMPNSMVTVSAIVEEITYTVSVDEETARMLNVTIRNEGDYDSIVENGGSVKYNDRITLSYEFKVQGYTLNYWTNQNGERLSATSILVQSNLVISATFSPNQYNLKIDDRWREDGDYNSAGTTSFYLLNKDGQRIDLLSNSTERNKARTDEEITIHCDPKNQNFAVEYFILRYNNNGLHEEHLTTNTFNMLPHNIEVSVKMKLVEHTYNINYVLDGGTMPNDAPTTFKSTDESLVIANPTRDRYRFEGWKEEDIINVSDLDVAISLTPFELTEDLTLTANWVRVAYITYDYSHNYQYDLDGFKGKHVDDNNPSNYALGETITFKDPIYAYGDFKGWYTSPTFEEESKITVWVGDENDLVDITLYAKMDLKSFHINFVKVRVAPDGTRRTLASSAYLDWFNLAEDPRDLTRAMYNEKTYTLGYTFGGFYTDFDLTEPITSVSNEETQDIIVYAKESVEVYQIEYYEYHNGQYEKVIIPNAATAYYIDTPAFQLPNSYYQNGYFRGWRLNNEGEVFEPYTQITPSQDPDKYHGTLRFYAYYQS